MIEYKNTIDQLESAYSDIFTSPQVRNWIGAILEVLNGGDEAFIRYYFEDGNPANWEEFFHLAFLGMSHEQMLRREKACFNALYEQMMNALMQEILPSHPDKEIAQKILLMLNVEEANRVGQLFDFELWRHGLMINIQPIRADHYLSTDHSIGNSILIHEDDLSLLENMNYKEKQKRFLDSSFQPLKSSQFFHTARIFREYRDWNAVSVVDNRVRIVRKFKEDLKAVYEELNRRKRGRYKC